MPATPRKFGDRNGGSGLAGLNHGHTPWACDRVAVDAVCVFGGLNMPIRWLEINTRCVCPFVYVETERHDMQEQQPRLTALYDLAAAIRPFGVDQTYAQLHARAASGVFPVVRRSRLVYAVGEPSDIARLVKAFDAKRGRPKKAA